MATIGWQQTLIDEDSPCLRGMNEGYRTWILRNQKIQMTLRTLEKFDRLEPPGKAEQKIQQLKAMTIGQQQQPQEEDLEDPTLAVVRDVEAVLKQTIESFQTLSSNQEDEAVKTSAVDTQGEGAWREEAGLLEKFRTELFRLDHEVDNVFEKQYNAYIDLKDFEHSVLAQWKERKEISEYWSKRHSVLRGMRYVMRSALQWYEWRLTPEGRSAGAGEHDAAAEDAGGEGGAATGKNVLARMEEEREKGELNSEPERCLEGYDADVVDPVAGPHAPALSDVLAEDATDQKERAEILKREHEGSREHPYGCRPCHFQGGLCWKGLACSFCHICPKPKRKSKHQRDVDKRRQERYRQVKVDLGIECLDELTKIDDGRRQIMTSSEEVKKRLKDAYSSGDQFEIDAMKQIVYQMQQTIDKYAMEVPYLFATPEDGADSDDAERGQAAFEEDKVDEELAPAAARRTPPPPPVPAPPPPKHEDLAEPARAGGAGLPNDADLETEAEASDFAASASGSLPPYAKGLPRKGRGWSGTGRGRHYGGSKGGHNNSWERSDMDPEAAPWHHQQFHQHQQPYSPPPGMDQHFWSQPSWPMGQQAPPQMVRYGPPSKGTPPPGAPGPPFSYPHSGPPQQYVWAHPSAGWEYGLGSWAPG